MRFISTFQDKLTGVYNFDAIGRECVEIAKALFEEDENANEHAAKLLKEAKAFQDKKKEAGRKGGLAKSKNAKEAEETKPSNHPTTSQKPTNPPKRKKPPTKEQVYEFARNHSLDEVDARDWYERNFVERPGCDETGEVIRNWPGALIRSCQAAAKKREKENK